MRLVNRAAITVIPKQPYIDWANGFAHLGIQLTSEHRPEPYLYLIEDISEYLVSPEEVAKRYFRDIFKYELRAWHSVERDWPRKRDFATFNLWFEVHVHSMVLDMHDGRLDTEPFGT